MQKKRVLIISDKHCGSTVGLTPPFWHQSTLNVELWNLFVSMIDNVRPIDVLIDNGDGIDGKASRWGSTGLITADRKEQCDMAVECIEVVGAKEVYLTRGTAYHSGRSEDWEDIVAERLKAPIEDQLWVDVNGVVFDVKHFVSASQVPYGRHTAIAKDRVWNLLWAEMGQQPKSDVFIRSHVHSFNYAGGASWLAMTTPALQGLGSKFGSRIPSGTVDFGIVWVDIDENGNIENWDHEVILIESQKANVYEAGGEDA